MSFLAELKRRNVIRMAGLYVVSAWLIVQVAETLLPAFEIPNWVLRAIIIVLALGFIPTLIFSWVFELTPEGLKRESEIDRAQSVTAQTSQRMDRLLLFGLIAVVGLMIVDRLWPRAPADSGEAGSASTFVAKDEASPAGAKTKVDADPTSANSVRGIAVLPFTNLSPDPDNAFFAGGVYEEVLTKLARLADLRVISRTSMERIAEEKLEVSAIGRRLGVSHVLEGSVRRAGNQVRVTVQLIEAESDAHVWAENYDRGLDDVFAIQSEIALAIADQLKLSLSPQLQADLGERPTQDPAAYELYLRALQERQNWRGVVGFRAVIDLLEQAVQRDDQFIVAKGALVDAYGRMHWLRADPDGAYQRNARSVMADLELHWPTHPETALARARLHYNIDRDYERALKQFEALQTSLPNHPMRLLGAAACLKRLNRHAEFLAAARRNLEIDPESPLVRGELIQALMNNERYDEALNLGEAEARRFSSEQRNEGMLAEARLLGRQDVDAVLRYGDRTPPPSFDMGGETVVTARFMRGDVDGALALIAQQEWVTPRAEAWGAAMRAELLRLAGRLEESRQLADEAYAVARATTDSETPRADLGVAFWYASAAQMAGVAGAREDVLRWQEQALGQPLLAIDDKWLVARSLSAAHRGLGDPETAWSFIAPYAGDGRILPRAELRALKPYYDKLFGDSPSYQAYMRQIGEPQ
ncbi:MAG: hypothetical protein KDJ14_07000 [Xanthomonadales bacterium]|nr:hypothetical protein [Xanthomonadales bacterium]